MSFIGGFLVLWGAFAVYAGLFRMKEEDFRSKSPIGASAYIEVELAVRWLTSRLSIKALRSAVLAIGISLLGIGTFIL